MPRPRLILGIDFPADKSDVADALVAQRPMLWFGPDGAIEAANAAAHVLFDYPEGELLGLTLADLSGDGHDAARMAAHAEAWDEIAAGDVRSETRRLLDRRDRRVDTVLTYAPCGPKDEPEGIVALLVPLVGRMHIAA